MKLEPVAWALYWKPGDLSRVTTNEADAMSFIPYNKGTTAAIPLYAIPEGYVVVPLTDEIAAAMITKEQS